MCAPSDGIDDIDDLMDEFGAHIVTGLSELLAGANLSGCLNVAMVWCQGQGFDSVAEIKEVGEEQAFMDALKLKPGKAKLLLKRISELG